MFQGKSILITGASSGIGAALARRFALDGARLILVARRHDRLRALAEELASTAEDTQTITADLVEVGASARILDEIRGPIDVLINNAGVGEYGTFSEQSLSNLQRMMHLNMDALVELTHLVLQQMLKRRSGHVVNVASTAAFQPTPFMAVYGASKAFVLNFSMSLWAEVRRRGIDITCVCPGPVATEFFDRGGYESRKAEFSKTALDPEALADAIHECLSRRDAVFVPGILNKLGVFLQRFVPIKTVTKVSAKILGPVSRSE